MLLSEPKRSSARRQELLGMAAIAYPASQTPWQEIQRGMVDQLEAGMVLNSGDKISAHRRDVRNTERQSLTGERRE